MLLVDRCRKETKETTGGGRQHKMQQLILSGKMILKEKRDETKNKKNPKTTWEFS